ncbi:MAG: hypothetical protein COA82_01345 [Alkaliphilus sp.]|nr:hypothetical protein [Alkaliphilus sp. AH-315-G20]PHS36255.1 MAG: hypothetical protein COA82_01345 [Alkaliphilus sp.]
MSRMARKKNRKNRSKRRRAKSALFIFILVMMFVGIMTTDYVLRTMLALNDEKRVVGYIWSEEAHVVQFMGSKIIIEQDVFLSRLNDMVLWVSESLGPIFTRIMDMFITKDQI